MFQVSVRYLSIDGRMRKCFSFPIKLYDAQRLYAYYHATGHTVDMIKVGEENGAK